MPFLDRLRIARYRSPSGTEFAFEFRELRRSGSKKAAVHELIQQDLPEVQDLGQAAVTLPIQAIFSGADYDQTADEFWDALAERGPGILMHPRWGDVRVLPLTVSQKESFVDGMRQAVFDIDFVRVTDIAYPVTTVQAETEIGTALDDTGIENIEIEPENAGQTAAVKQSFGDMIDGLSDNISAVISAVDDVSEEFERLVRDFENTIDTLILDPLMLIQSFIRLARTPARAETSILAKVHGYKLTIDMLHGLALETGVTYAETETRIAHAIALLMGMSESTLTGSLDTRLEALRTIELIQDATITALEVIEQAEAASGEYTAPSDVLAAIQAIIAQTIGMLLERSFALKIKRRITLEEDHTPLDLVYKLKKPKTSEALEQALDEFIEQNNLQGDEIFLIPRGREVIYYAG